MRARARQHQRANDRVGLHLAHHRGHLPAHGGVEGVALGGVAQGQRGHAVLHLENDALVYLAHAALRGTYDARMSRPPRSDDPPSTGMTAPVT